jgi:hypothetical protein
MHGIGSVSRLWRKLAKAVLMGDERAWLRVPGAAAAAECMACFPRALSLRIVGDGRVGDIGAVLGSRSVMRLAIADNGTMRSCESLGQLVGLRALHITKCGRLRDAAALSSLVDLRTLHVTFCRLGAGSLAPSLALMAQLTSLDLQTNTIGAAGADALGWNRPAARTGRFSSAGHSESPWPRDRAGGRDALVRRLCALATPFVSMAFSSVYKRKRCRLRVPNRRTEN